jgi:hypothetical protein
MGECRYSFRHASRLGGALAVKEGSSEGVEQL